MVLFFIKFYCGLILKYFELQRNYILSIVIEGRQTVAQQVAIPVTIFFDAYGTGC